MTSRNAKKYYEKKLRLLHMYTRGRNRTILRKALEAIFPALTVVLNAFYGHEYFETPKARSVYKASRG